MRKYQRVARKRWVSELGLLENASYVEIAQKVEEKMGSRVIVDFQKTKENCAQFLWLIKETL